MLLTKAKPSLSAWMGIACGLVSNETLLETIMKLEDKEILTSLTDDHGYGLLILEGNIAVMDLGSGYEGAVAVDNDDLSQAFDRWLGDTRAEDHASNEIIQFVAKRV